MQRGSPWRRSGAWPKEGITLSTVRVPRDLATALLRRVRSATSRSWRPWRLIQNSADVPKYRPSRIAASIRILTLLRDSPATYTEWKRLVIKHSVVGVKVHDTRLVAAMNVHGVGRILTFNVDDFARYGIEVLHPSSVGA